MNRVERKIAATALFAALTLGTGSALAQSPIDDPGYVDFGSLSTQLGATPQVNLNFGGAMLALFAEGVRESDSNLADLLGGLSGLRVTVFENVDAATARPFAADLADRLTAGGWEPAMNVRDSDTYVDLLLRTSDNKVRGLALMVTEESGTAVFINVVGQLDPAAVGRLISGAGLDSSALNALAAMAAQAEANGETD